jgi:hypothetical protein
VRLRLASHGFVAFFFLARNGLSLVIPAPPMVSLLIP